MKAPNGTSLTAMANAIRALSMDAVQAANSGHPGMPMGMADVATVLWSRHMKFDPATDTWTTLANMISSRPGGGHACATLGDHIYVTGNMPVNNHNLRYTPSISICVPAS